MLSRSVTTNVLRNRFSRTSAKGKIRECVIKKTCRQKKVECANGLPCRLFVQINKHSGKLKSAVEEGRGRLGEGFLIKSDNIGSHVPFDFIALFLVEMIAS